MSELELIKYTEKVITGEEAFVHYFSKIQNEVNQTAHDKGWYDSPLKQLIEDSSISKEFGTACINELQQAKNGLRLALFHSEVSEALENLRAGQTPDDKIPEFSGVEAELADVIIRIMVCAEENGWRVAEAVVAKARFNKTRPYKHGKKF